jgi:sugar phosphate isomerase/epimerase
MILSLAALSILDAGPAGQVRACAEAGFTHAGLRLNPLLATDQAVAGDAAKEAEIEQLMAESGVKLLEVGVFPVTAHMNVEALWPVLKLSQHLGGRFIVCPVEDDDLARRRDTFGRLCDLAADFGLNALVEFNPYSGCRSLAEAVDVATSVKRTNAGLVIDALHLSRSGGHPRDLAQVDPALLQLVHFCDAPAFVPGNRSVEELRKESRTARLLPGEGELWLADLLRALPVGTPISIEAPSARHAHLSAAERARLALTKTQTFLDAQGLSSR